MITKFSLVYFVSVAALGVLLIWWTKNWIFKTKTERRASIKKLKRFEPLRTATPVDTPVADAKKAALESVEYQFSIIKKISFFLIVTIWITALVYPFLRAVPATFVSVLVGASGIILGVASRPFIENLISGIVISFSGLTRIGDTILIDDKYGTVEDITLTHTVMKIWNWQRYIIPNGRMLTKEIINYTIHDAYQWAHVEFSVAYDSDLETVKKLAVNATSTSKYCADYEPPSFWIMEMGEKGYKCWVAAWANSPIDAWELRSDIRANLIARFKANGIKTHKFETGCSSAGLSEYSG